MKRCPICQGARIIRLPLHREVSALVPKAEMIAKAEESYRTYPCPECENNGYPAGIITVGSVQVVSDRDIDASGGKVIDYVKEHTAVAIGHHLLEEGMIAFEETPSDYGRKIRGIIGVSTANAAAKLDKDLTHKASELLDGVDEEVVHQIQNWGSYFSGNGGIIEKSMAVQFMRDVFRKRMETVRERLRA